MTVLILAHNALLRRRSAIADGLDFGWFREYNKYGLISFGIISLLIISLISYLATIYFIINTGFAIQKHEEVMAEISEDFLAIELAAQSGRTKLAEDQKSVLESMEKISAVKYLLPKSFVSFENSSNRP